MWWSMEGISFLSANKENDIKTTDDLKIYDNTRKTETGQGDHYTNGWLLDSLYLEKYCKLIAIDLSKQPKLDADPKPIQQINFTGNLNRAECATMFFIVKEAKETVLGFSKWTIRVLWFYFILI